MSPSTCKLLSSYLSNRSQFVSQGADCSRLGYSSKGVPQGSVLGPLLFTLYINDLPSTVKHSKCHLFADDVQLQITVPNKNPDESIKHLNCDLAAIKVWAQKYDLNINPGKSQAIMITRSIQKQMQCPAICLGNVEIPRTSEVKNLGVWFDDRMSWSRHVTVVCGRVKWLLSRLWKIAWAVPKETRLTLVRALIIPIISYGIIVVRAMSSKCLLKLERVLNSCTRYVLGRRKYDRLGHERNIILGCSLKTYIDRVTCETLYKILTTREPQYLYNKLLFSHSQRTLNLKTPIQKLALSKGMFYLRSIAIWNSLPVELKRLTRLNDFKLHLAEYLT